MLAGSMERALWSLAYTKDFSILSALGAATVKPIHPFPARMAPEILIDKLQSIGSVERLWDPMCGSGTSLRVASSKGIPAYGSDTDPLAVKMANVGTRNFDAWYLHAYIELLAERITKSFLVGETCEETLQFKKYWFAEPQRVQLGSLAQHISHIADVEMREFFEIALSRTIITKFRGASLAWDVSHSRPHRMRHQNDFDVAVEFLASARRLAALCLETPHFSNVDVARADAREHRPPGQYDLVVTSPPYLNAIDYMRGHKFSLVWMGWTIPELRTLRSKAIGSERRLNETSDEELKEVELATIDSPAESSRLGSIIARYIRDCAAMMANVRRHMSSTAQLIMVVADSNVRGYRVKSDRLFQTLAAMNGLTLVDTSEREIPSNRRYLPAGTSIGIGNRMKREWVLHFAL